VNAISRFSIAKSIKLQTMSEKNNSAVWEFFIQSLSCPRRRASRNVLLKKLDARLRGHDGKNSPTAQINSDLAQYRFLCDPLLSGYG
jgi:hypothetical protein